MLVYIVTMRYLIIARCVAKWGSAQTCLCETRYQGGGIAPFWGSANLPRKVSHNMGYRSDSIVISRDMGPLSVMLHTKLHLHSYTRIISGSIFLAQGTGLMSTHSWIAHWICLRGREVVSKLYVKQPVHYTDFCFETM